MSELATIAMSHSEPWLIAGDLNDFFFSDEKSGGAVVKGNKCKNSNNGCTIVTYWILAFRDKNLRRKVMDSEREWIGLCAIWSGL